MIGTLLVVTVMIIMILAAIVLKTLLTIPFICGYHKGYTAEARNQILDTLNKSDEKIYPSETAERLHIDYDLCLEIIEELLKEGQVKIESEEEKRV